MIAELVLFHADSRAFLEWSVPGHADNILGGIQICAPAALAGYTAFTFGDLLRGAAGRCSSTAHSIGSAVLKEVLLLSAVTVLCAWNSLPWSVVMYFTLGHSLEAWQKEFMEDQQVTTHFGDYYREAIPLSIVSTLGLIGVGNLVVQGVLPPALAVSLLLAGTVPHVLLLDWWVPAMLKGQWQNALQRS